MADKLTGLRERTRQAVRAELMAVAVQLFLDQGYEATTVEQISVAAGLSRRSFFRYFASKDEVLAQALGGTGAAIAAAVAERPGGEASWVALRRGFDVLVEQVASDDRARAMTQVMLQSPSMLASHAAKQSSWLGSIAAALQARLPQDGQASLSAEALAGAALACLTVAQSQWVESAGGDRLEELLDITMGAIAPIHSPA